MLCLFQCTMIVKRWLKRSVTQKRPNTQENGSFFDSNYNSHQATFEVEYTSTLFFVISSIAQVFFFFFRDELQ
jgi:hypothetical protein